MPCAVFKSVVSKRGLGGSPKPLGSCGCEEVMKVFEVHANFLKKA